MRTALLIAAAVLVAAGCNKKTKLTGASDDGPKPLPSAGNGKPAGKDTPAGEKPNWLTDPRFKKDGVPAQPTSEGSSGKPGWGITSPEGGWAPPAGTPAKPGTPPAGSGGK